MSREAMQLALDALEEIALSGMSPALEASHEHEVKEFHARQAWRFIGLAARALEAIKTELAKPEQAAVAQVVEDFGNGAALVELLKNPLDENTLLYESPQTSLNLTDKAVQKRLAAQWGYSVSESAALIEREACAQIAEDEEIPQIDEDFLRLGDDGPALKSRIAKAIRARGKTSKTKGEQK